MPTHIRGPQRIAAVGNPAKLIEEYVGRVNTATNAISIARMKSPPGWTEPGQRPDFDEFSVVLSGMLRVTHSEGVIDVCAGEAVVAHRSEWVRYSTPGSEGAEYLAICVPAFSPETVHRDADG
jgi:mannose-6-phosphate isomerase-like protein (cupin superfamily)